MKILHVLFTVALFRSSAPAAAGVVASQTNNKERALQEPDCVNNLPLGAATQLDPPSSSTVTVNGDTTFSNFPDAPSCNDLFVGDSPGEWYTFTTGINGGTVTVSLCGSSYDTVLSVYDDHDGQGCLRCVDACDDCGGCGLQSQLFITTQPNTDYYVLVHGYVDYTFGGDYGPFFLSIQGDTGPAATAAPTTQAPTTEAPTITTTTKAPSDGGGEEGGDNTDNGDDGSSSDDGVNVVVNNVFCFSERSTVQVQGMGMVAMKDLAIGDLVLTGDINSNKDNNNNNSRFEKIYAFGHYDPHKSATFVQLTIGSTEENKETKVASNTNTLLELSPEHLIYKKDKTHPIRADSIRVGDMLEGGGAHMKNMRVIKIGNIQRKGVYAPLTPSGNILVNGVLASSYVSFQQDNNNNNNNNEDNAMSEFVQLRNSGSSWMRIMSHHDYAHMGLAPLRLACMGISSYFCTATNQESNMPLYIHYGIQLTHWVLHDDDQRQQQQQSLVIQIIVLLAIFLLTGPSFVLERVFGGASWAPLLVTVTVATFVWMKRQRIFTIRRANHKSKCA